MEGKAQILADHLRTVHFALVLSAAVLVLGSLEPGAPDIMRAADTASTIDHVKAKLPEISHRVSEIIENTKLRRYRNESDNRELLVKFKRHRKVFFPAGPDEVSTPDELCRRPALCPGSRAHNPTDLQSALSGAVWAARPSEFTVSFFEALWDFPVTYYSLPDVPGRLNFNCHKQSMISYELRVGGPAATPSDKPDLELIYDLKQGTRSGNTEALQDDDYAQASISNPNSAIEPDSNCVASLGSIRKETLRLGAIIANTIGEKNWDTSADFAEAFSVLLNQTTTAQRDYMPVSSLARELRERSQDAAAAVEILGLKLNKRALVTIGALALLLCQLYFWAHLGELIFLLRGLRPEHWPTGYVLLYESSWAAWGSGATVCLVPVVSLGIVMAFGRGSLNEAGPIMLATVVLTGSIAMALVTAGRVMHVSTLRASARGTD